MKKISAVLLISFALSALAGCALNPFADDNIYSGSKQPDKASDGAKPKQ